MINRLVGVHQLGLLHVKILIDGAREADSLLRELRHCHQVCLPHWMSFREEKTRGLPKYNLVSVLLAL